MRTNVTMWRLGAVACLSVAGFCPVPTHASLPVPLSPQEKGLCLAPPEHSLPVHLSPQEQTYWCWAASGQMVMNFLGATVIQCDEANKQFDPERTDCCDSPVPSDCDVVGWPEPEKYGFTYKTTSDEVLPWKDVQDEIYCKHRPFAFTWRYPGGKGHMMVAVTYRNVAGKRLVGVNDPNPRKIGDYWENTYEYIDALPGHHTHWNDYYAFARAGVK
ncbi:uncharacterized protein SOCE836_101050 [Sorangium cellulosum]|uniref:Secreted protein n=2 Tax=Polyangiaceae TaxID=49 RepID=A0A4P2R475_SORCE|nr:uncharacterized protein SOCE836_101050 [Sorangium cellulosum]WCQ97158.1 hypothetical protein NQZ70_09949 [Sorangium sp. Soce836]